MKTYKYFHNSENSFLSIYTSIIIGNYFQNILEAETWIYDLKEANRNSSNNPTWFKLYSFKDRYGVESLTPMELDKLTHKLATDRSLLEEYSR
jgi:DNA replication protein DnaD